RRREPCAGFSSWILTIHHLFDGHQVSDSLERPFHAGSPRVHPARPHAAEAEGIRDPALALRPPDQAAAQGEPNPGPRGRHVASHPSARRPRRSSTVLLRILATSRGSRISSSPLSVARAWLMGLLLPSDLVRMSRTPAASSTART